jgi:hypothetical protein
MGPIFVLGKPLQLYAYDWEITKSTHFMITLLVFYVMMFFFRSIRQFTMFIATLYIVFVLSQNDDNLAEKPNTWVSIILYYVASGITHCLMTCQEDKEKEGQIQQVETSSDEEEEDNDEEEEEEEEEEENDDSEQKQDPAPEPAVEQQVKNGDDATAKSFTTEIPVFSWRFHNPQDYNGTDDKSDDDSGGDDEDEDKNDDKPNNDSNDSQVMAVLNEKPNIDWKALPSENIYSPESYPLCSVFTGIKLKVLHRQLRLWRKIAIALKPCHDPDNYPIQSQIEENICNHLKAISDIHQDIIKMKEVDVLSIPTGTPSHQKKIILIMVQQPSKEIRAPDSSPILSPEPVPQNNDAPEPISIPETMTSSSVDIPKPKDIAPGPKYKPGKFINFHQNIVDDDDDDDDDDQNLLDLSITS